MTPYTIITAEIKCPRCDASFSHFEGVNTPVFQCGSIAQRAYMACNYAATLLARVKELEKGMPINTSERLLDLVRYSRASLHEDGLVTDGEYAWLCGVGSQSARRLEEYDFLRARVKELEEALNQIANQDYRGNRSVESQIAYAALKKGTK